MEARKDALVPGIFQMDANIILAQFSPDPMEFKAEILNNIREQIELQMKKGFRNFLLTITSSKSI